MTRIPILVFATLFVLTARPGNADGVASAELEHKVIRLPMVDGNDIRFHKLSTEDSIYPDSLGDVYITALFKDRSGTPWTGCDQFLERFDRKTERFTHFSLDAKDAERGCLDLEPTHLRGRFGDALVFDGVALSACNNPSLTRCEMDSTRKSPGLDPSRGFAPHRERIHSFRGHAATPILNLREWGLLVLRLAISCYLLHRASSQLGDSTTAPVHGLPQSSLDAQGCLLLGLWTPLAGMLAALIEAWDAFSPSGNTWEAVLAAAIALSVASLGPGSSSIDALSYGRKRISIDRP